MKKRRFKIAFSFPGEYRELVSKIVRGVEEIFTRQYVFYDEFYAGELARLNLDIYLQDIYSKESELIVVFICGDYNRKKWCGVEWRAIRDMFNDKGEDDRILFIKCGDGDVAGFHNNIDGYIDSTRFSYDEIVSMILSRYQSLTEKEQSRETVRQERRFSDTHTKKWNYNIILMDDVEEQLDMLEEEINLLIEIDGRYDVQIIRTTNTRAAARECQYRDIDVFVLDVATRPSLSKQMGEFDYYGYDFYKQLISEKPNVAVESKFYVLSKLPMQAVRNEFQDADVTFLRKQETNSKEMAQYVKEYLDSLYIKERLKIL